jgi:ribosomal protein S17
VFEKPHWRTVLTTKVKAKAFAMAKEIGDKVRIEEITPKVKKRRRQRPVDDRQTANNLRRGR